MKVAQLYYTMIVNSNFKIVVESIPEAEVGREITCVRLLRHLIPAIQPAKISQIISNISPPMLHKQSIKDLEEVILAKMAEPEVAMVPAEEYRPRELTITNEFTPTHTAGIPPDPETIVGFPLLTAIPEITTRINTSLLC